MKNNNPYMLRAMYIILVPVVLLIILLNSGVLQRYISAGSVNGEKVNVVRYNYYYYDYQTTFHHEHKDELTQMGYDPNRDAEKQSYSPTMTWKEFFQQQAEANMAFTAYYCDLAEQAGYEFSQEELAPIAAKLQENSETATANGIKMKNYYVAYYGPGMTEEIYTEELTRVVKARAYKQHLMENYSAGAEEMNAYLAANPGEEYEAVRLRVVVLNALPDRVTGEVGQAQLDALQSRLDALAARYEQGTPVEELQVAFSEKSAQITLLTKETDLPAAFAEHYILHTDGSAPALAFVDETNGVAYFAVRVGSGGSGREASANLALGVQNVEANEAEQIPAYKFWAKTFGMLLAAS